MKQLQLYLPKHKVDIGFQGLNIYSPVKKLKMTNIFVALVVRGVGSGLRCRGSSL